jgi:NAD(P)-dependent dehydrogenase (short-subunit alcohol dehydrogenase family)
MSFFSLSGKRAFVTGAGGGIGLAVAERFAQAGAEVVIADIRDPSDAAQRIKAGAVTLDVGNENAFASALEAAGPLDIIVNNAGILGAEVPIAEQSVENLDLMLKINLQSVHHALKHGQKVLRDSGSIINTSSYNAFIGIRETPHYAVTKAGMNALTRNGAVELGHRGIRVNAVCPAYVQSGMSGGDEVFRIAKRVCPLQRAATTDDLVGLYHFLAADESRYLTGQAIVIDGGWSAGLTPAAWEQLSAE